MGTLELIGSINGSHGSHGKEGKLTNWKYTLQISFFTTMEDEDLCELRSEWSCQIFCTKILFLRYCESENRGLSSP